MHLYYSMKSGFLARFMVSVLNLSRQLNPVQATLPTCPEMTVYEFSPWLGLM